jgi:predicted acyl esterase
MLAVASFGPMSSRPTVLVVVSCVLVVSLAGCASKTPVEDPPMGTIDPQQVPREIPLHAVARVLPFETTAPDEIVLRGHVYLPNGTGPFAVILNYSPYWNAINGDSEEQNAAAADGRASMAGIFGPLLDAGFAIALINVRGTGESDGCNAWLNPSIDGPDAASIIQNLAAQPWSNGNVGMVGISWHGYSQYASLYDQPPALKAVAPASAVLDLWTLFTRRGPTINSQFGPMATTYAAFQSLVGVGIEGDAPPNRAQCPEHVAQIQAFNQLTLDGDKSAFMRARDLQPVLRNNTIPMLVTNGLGSGEGHILQADGLWELMPTERRLFLGQWGHAYPDDDLADVYPKMLVQWFDHYLRGGPKTVPTGLVDWQDDQNGWHQTPTWPPAGATKRLHLSTLSLVDAPEKVAASAQTFQSVYLDPQPDLCPGTKAVYVSPPLKNDVLLAGHFFADLTVKSTRDNGNFGLFLWHLDALDPCPGTDPQVSLVTESDVEVGRAISDLRHRGQLEQGKPFPVGSADVMSMRSHPFASVVKAGERLVLAVSGGALEVAPRQEMPTLVVQTGPNVEGWIDIPVFEGVLEFQS